MLSDKIKKNEMGREQTEAESVFVGIPERRDHFEDLGVYGNITLMLSSHLHLGESWATHRMDGGGLL
jgi:hypothetical protein